ncbi:UNVERIFIED_CONTAM: hypothetical protein Sradi_0891500 [Sesamum radiatum]|uniref:DDE Tnp4 domain-containing protein n=1 Tax=Sesamum radiatum TaxID=300843 RepID=A0AAW2V2P0_SESRA
MAYFLTMIHLHVAIEFTFFSPMFEVLQASPIIGIHTAALRLNTILLAKPVPITDECQDSRWKYFKGCLGALDGTHIEVRVPNSDKGRYRNRKCQISINVLGVCNTEGKFIYALSGWEGSAADGRVLRDAIHRPTGLKVPTGKYYLYDNGYSNVEGFLMPYRGVRYHLKEWDRG